MVDNVDITPGTGATVGADEIGGVKFQRVKLIHGADGTNDGDVSSANGLPVSILSAVPGTGATSLGKAEDAVHSSGDVGVMALAVRADSAVTTAGTDGDYTALLTDANGRLWTSIGTVTPGTGSSNLGKTEDSAHSSGATGVMMLGVRQDAAAALAGTDGDYIPPIFDSSGKQWVNTNLDTNLASVVTAVQIMDDWDESDRAKVNPIVGQAGVAAGAGAVAATVQRMTLASDDPAVASLALLDNAIGAAITSQTSKTRPSDTTTYADGDVINESTSAGSEWVFTSCARANGTGGMITGVYLIQSTAETLKLACDLWLFTAAPGDDNDNAAFTPTDAEAQTLVAIIPLINGRVGSGNYVQWSGPLSETFKCGGGTTSLFGVLVARNAYVPVSAEVIDILIKIVQD